MVVSGADGLDGSAGDLHIEDEAPALAARAADHYLVVHRLLFFAKQTGEMAGADSLSPCARAGAQSQVGARTSSFSFFTRARGGAERRRRGESEPSCRWGPPVFLFDEFAGGRGALRSGVSFTNTAIATTRSKLWLS